MKSTKLAPRVIKSAKFASQLIDFAEENKRFTSQSHSIIKKAVIMAYCLCCKHEEMTTGRNQPQLSEIQEMLLEEQIVRLYCTMQDIQEWSKKLKHRPSIFGLPDRTKFNSLHEQLERLVVIFKLQHISQLDDLLQDYLEAEKPHNDTPVTEPIVAALTSLATSLSTSLHPERILQSQSSSLLESPSVTPSSPSHNSFDSDGGPAMGMPAFNPDINTKNININGNTSSHIALNSHNVYYRDMTIFQGTHSPGLKGRQ